MALFKGLGSSGAGQNRLYGDRADSGAGSGPFADAVTLVDQNGVPIAGGGDASAANQVTMNTRIGDLTEAAPATDTGSSGLNGRLQRIAQRLTSILGVLPAALAAGGGLKVEGVAGGVAQPVSLASVPTHGVAGDVASGTADSGNPVKMGGIARTTLPTKVADAQRSNLLCDATGRQVVTSQPRELVARGSLTLTTTTETALLAAQGAGIFADLVEMLVTNTSATAVQAQIRDATAGTIQFTVMAEAGKTTVFPFPVPIKQTTANNAWTVVITGAVTDVRVMAQFILNT